MMRVLIGLLSALAAPILVFGQTIVRTGHGDALRTGFDMSGYRAAWTSGQWCVECIFFDLNGDGIDEVMTSPINIKDRMGDVWHHWRSDSGTYRRLREDKEFAFSCMSSSFYKMHSRSKGDMLLGLGMDAGYIAANRIDFKEKTPDCVFRLESDEKQVISPVVPSFDVMFAKRDVSSVERLYSEWYFGFDFRPPAPDPHSPYTTWLGYQRPKGDLRPGGGVVKPDCFDVLASRHRSSIKARKGITSTVDVLAVFLDADNDGKTDCYVSSSAEEADAGKFVWTLHVNRDGVLTPAKDAVYPVAEKKELCALPATAKLGKDGFCRVVRFDVNPIFVLLDGSGSPTKVRDSITDIMAHRIEKLECVSFPEEPTAGRQD